jgi:hypothetical protein
MGEAVSVVRQQLEVLLVEHHRIQIETEIEIGTLSKT